MTVTHASIAMRCNVVVIQAWGDMLPALAAAESNHFENGLESVCVMVGVAGADAMLLSSPYVTALYKMKRHSLKSMVGWVRQRKEATRVVNLIGQEVERLVFFSDWLDLATFHLVNKYKKSADLILRRNYAMDGVPSKQVGAKIIEVFIWGFFGVRITICASNIPSLHYFWRLPSGIEVMKVSTPDTLNASLYIHPVSSDALNILIIDGVEKSDEPYWRGIATEYDEIIRQLRNFGKIGLYLKCHPRIGVREICEGKFDDILPINLPLELVDTNTFDMVVAIHSTSLARIEHPKRYALLMAMENITSNRKSELYAYLRQMGLEDTVFVAKKTDFFSEVKALLKARGDGST